MKKRYLFNHFSCSLDDKQSITEVGLDWFEFGLSLHPYLEVAIEEEAIVNCFG